LLRSRGSSDIASVPTMDLALTEVRPKGCQGFRSSV
jgi:hypothetical protein